MVSLTLFMCFSRWDPTKRMTPDEGIQHEWILEGNFNKVRPKTRPVLRKTSESLSSTENIFDHSYRKPLNSRPGKTKLFLSTHSEPSSALFTFEAIAEKRMVSLLCPTDCCYRLLYYLLLKRNVTCYSCAPMAVQSILVNMQHSFLMLEIRE